MARITRADIYSPDEVAIVHCVARVVRRCFLLGDDPVSKANFDHRKRWVEDLLRRFAACFGIDLIAYAVLSNHFHLVLRSRPDIVNTWSDEELARRWLMLCPLRKKADGSPEDPTDAEIRHVIHDTGRLRELRTRLSDISWWMRLLCQRIGKRANLEDGEVGRFFQGRFKSVRFLDEEAVLAGTAYVDLNWVRAALADSLETSDYTSVQRRIQAMNACKEGCPFPESARPDAFLAPIQCIGLESNGESIQSRLTTRASDRGFTWLSEQDYFDFLKSLARMVRPNQHVEPLQPNSVIFQRMQLDQEEWVDLVSHFEERFSTVAGTLETVMTFRSRNSNRPIFVKRAITRSLQPSEDDSNQQHSQRRLVVSTN